MSKEQIGKIVSIALVALVSLLAVFGYDIGVIQPREASGLLPLGAEVGERGMTANVLKLDNLQVRKSIVDNGSLAVAGNTTMAGDLAVTGAISGGTLACTSASWPVNVVITGTADIDGATTITGTTTLKGQTVIGDNGDTVAINSSDWDISTAGAMTGIGAITADGLASLNAGIAVDSTAFRVADTSGNTQINGSLVVTGTSTFGNLLTVNANGDFDSITVAGVSDLTSIKNTGANPITISDNAVVTGTLNVAGATTLTGALIHASTAITPTAGEVITPTAGLYIVNSSGAVSMTLGLPSAAGQMLYLYGDDAFTVTINDTNVRTSSGSSLSLGQYDVIQWISTATEWIEVALLANS